MNEQKANNWIFIPNSRGIKLIYYTQNRNWPRYSYNETVHKVSFQYASFAKKLNGYCWWTDRQSEEQKVTPLQGKLIETVCRLTDRTTDRQTESSKAICPPPHLFSNGTLLLCENNLKYVLYQTNYLFIVIIPR